MGENVQFTPPDRASAAETRASASATAGSKLAACASGVGKIVNCPWMTSSPISSGMPCALSSTAARCSALVRSALCGQNSAPDAAAGERERVLLVAAPDDLQLCELLSPRHPREERLRGRALVIEHPIVRRCSRQRRWPPGRTPGRPPDQRRGYSVPGRVHLLEHLVDRLLTGQQPLHADAEGVVDGRVRPRRVGQAGERARLQQLADRLVDGVDVVRVDPEIGTKPERSANS